MPGRKLRNAANIGDELLLCAELRTGVDVELPNSCGETALHLAARWGHTTCLDALLNGSLGAFC